jgi:hypothetical protein
MRNGLRFSKVYRHTWIDRAFQRLSAPAPNGQTLWLRLLSGPELGVIPGIIRTGEAALAEAMGWPMKGFREAFQEVSHQGLAEADWGARLVWLPKAIRYNPPQSPNVIKSWACEWELVPQCALKHDAYSTLQVFVEGLGEGFRKAFDMTIDKPSGEPFDKPCRNQEKEKEIRERDKRGGEALARPPAPTRGGLCPSSEASAEDVRAWALSQGLDIAHDEFASFLDHYRMTGSKTSGGTRVVDWPATWRKWLARSAKWAKDAKSSTRKLRAVQPVDPEAPWLNIPEVG